MLQLSFIKILGLLSGFVKCDVKKMKVRSSELKSFRFKMLIS